MRLLKILVGLILILSPSLYGTSVTGLPCVEHYEEVTAVLKKYKRPVTVLEIGQASSNYTFALASEFKTAFCTSLSFEYADYIASLAARRGSTNICVLAPFHKSHALYDALFRPQYLSKTNICRALSRCEHFDIAIIHDVDILFKNTAEIINVLVKLAEFVFFEVRSQKVANRIASSQIQLVCKSCAGALLVSHDLRDSLDIARYTQWRRRKPLEPKYHIESSFTQKLFYKEKRQEAVTWVPGINLITFVMLRGLYPTDSMMKTQLASLKQNIPHHNDLVLGNIVVQGTKLVPIDFNDKRRDANMDDCINAALKVFNSDKTRLRNPEKWINAYYDAL